MTVVEGTHVAVKFDGKGKARDSATETVFLYSCGWKIRKLMVGYAHPIRCDKAGPQDKDKDKDKDKHKDEDKDEDKETSRTRQAQLRNIPSSLCTTTGSALAA